MIHTLKSVVNEYLIEIGDTQLNRYARFYQIAVSGLREFNINSAGVSKAVELPIKDNDTVDLPEDYIKYSVIGLQGSDGQIHALGRNDSLSKVEGIDDCGGPTSLANNTSANPSLGYGLWQKDYGTSYRNGEFMGRMFGVRGGINPYGEFRIDESNGLIILTSFNNQTITQNGEVNSNLFINSIILEYLADISLINGDYRVHPFMIEALKSWLYYKDIERNRTIGGGEKDRARRSYYDEARKARLRFSSATIAEWTAAFRSGNTASVKW